MQRNGMQKDNLEMLRDTLQVLEKGYYRKHRRTIPLKLSRREMESARVLLPDEVEALRSRGYLDDRSESLAPLLPSGMLCGQSCENTDSFTMAVRRHMDLKNSFNKEEREKIMVLNFANPVNPGGGVRYGARAQEEDLCRKSSLLLSLESRDAARYYAYNREQDTRMGSDAVIFTPKVEIIKDACGELLDDTIVLSVLTCAAPMVTRGTEGMSEDEYREMVYRRILGMLNCSAYFGCSYLILGAWGCGAFGNDARVISDLFYRALRTMEYCGLHAKDIFGRVDFAVLDHTSEQYNFRAFSRNFASGHFFWEDGMREVESALKWIAERSVDREMIQDKNQDKKQNKIQDKIRGCLFGGAVGDALGYPVEFWTEREIFSRFGEEGIQQYVPDRSSRKAVFSDDTQMTLFTANGLLVNETRKHLQGYPDRPADAVAAAYQDWLRTQEMEQFTDNAMDDTKSSYSSWLMDVPGLYVQRAPGRTCMSALIERRRSGEAVENYVKTPENNSKGCGGVMRVAPVALYAGADAEIEKLDYEGAQAAAITHGHSLGYMPAAVLVHILHRIIYPKQPQTLKEIVLEAGEAAAELFAGDAYLNRLTQIITLAVRLAENKKNDLDNIRQLGEGWVAEETLAIAIYCALRHQDNFSAGVTAAVNHRGDSDSTGAVTGNILGAWLGFTAIEDKWKTNLELADVILEMADDLYHGCPAGERGGEAASEWAKKYIEMRRCRK